MDPLGTIETAIEARLDRMKTACKWTKEFLVSGCKRRESCFIRVELCETAVLYF